MKNDIIVSLIYFLMAPVIWYKRWKIRRGLEKVLTSDFKSPMELLYSVSDTIPEISSNFQVENLTFSIDDESKHRVTMMLKRSYWGSFIGRLMVRFALEEIDLNPETKVDFYFNKYYNLLSFIFAPSDFIEYNKMFLQLTHLERAYDNYLKKSLRLKDEYHHYFEAKKISDITWAVYNQEFVEIEKEILILKQKLNEAYGLRTLLTSKRDLRAKELDTERQSKTDLELDVDIDLMNQIKTAFGKPHVFSKNLVDMSSMFVVDR